MTIDEAIENLKEDYEIDMYIRDIAPQIAEWLEELEAYQQQHLELCEKYGVNTIEDLYNKAIDDLIDIAEKSQYGDVEGKEYVMEHLKAFAEQLKAGGENESK